MPEVTIQIGGRGFEVSCQEGEESYLQSAAKMLDDEAQVLSDQIGRMPEARMIRAASRMVSSDILRFRTSFLSRSLPASIPIMIR